MFKALVDALVLRVVSSGLEGVSWPQLVSSLIQSLDPKLVPEKLVLNRALALMFQEKSIDVFQVSQIPMEDPVTSEGLCRFKRDKLLLKKWEVNEFMPDNFDVFSNRSAVNFSSSGVILVARFSLRSAYLGFHVASKKINEIQYCVLEAIGKGGKSGTSSKQLMNLLNRTSKDLHTQIDRLDLLAYIHRPNDHIAHSSNHSRYWLRRYIFLNEEIVNIIEGENDPEEIINHNSETENPNLQVMLSYIKSGRDHIRSIEEMKFAFSNFETLKSKDIECVHFRRCGFEYNGYRLLRNISEIEHYLPEIQFEGKNIKEYVISDVFTLPNAETLNVVQINANVDLATNILRFVDSKGSAGCTYGQLYLAMHNSRFKASTRIVEKLQKCGDLLSVALKDGAGNLEDRIICPRHKVVLLPDGEPSFGLLLDLPLPDIPLPFLDASKAAMFPSVDNIIPGDLFTFPPVLLNNSEAVLNSTVEKEDKMSPIFKQRYDYCLMVLKRFGLALHLHIRKFLANAEKSNVSIGSKTIDFILNEMVSNGDAKSLESNKSSKVIYSPTLEASYSIEIISQFARELSYGGYPTWSLTGDLNLDLERWNLDSIPSWISLSFASYFGFLEFGKRMHALMLYIQSSSFENLSSCIEMMPFDTFLMVGGAYPKLPGLEQLLKSGSFNERMPKEMVASILGHDGHDSLQNIISTFNNLSDLNLVKFENTGYISVLDLNCKFSISNSIEIGHTILPLREKNSVSAAFASIRNSALTEVSNGKQNSSLIFNKESWDGQIIPAYFSIESEDVQSDVNFLIEKHALFDFQGIVSISDKYRVSTLIFAKYIARKRFLFARSFASDCFYYYSLATDALKNLVLEIIRHVNPNMDDFLPKHKKARKTKVVKSSKIVSPESDTPIFPDDDSIFEVIEPILRDKSTKAKEIIYPRTLADKTVGVYENVENRETKIKSDIIDLTGNICRSVVLLDHDVPTSGLVINKNDFITKPRLVALLNLLKVIFLNQSYDAGLCAESSKIALSLFDEDEVGACFRYFDERHWIVRLKSSSNRQYGSFGASRRFKSGNIASKDRHYQQAIFKADNLRNEGIFDKSNSTIDQPLPTTITGGTTAVFLAAAAMENVSFKCQPYLDDADIQSLVRRDELEIKVSDENSSDSDEDLPGIKISNVPIPAVDVSYTYHQVNSIENKIDFFTETDVADIHSISYELIVENAQVYKPFNELNCVKNEFCTIGDIENLVNSIQVAESHGLDYREILNLSFVSVFSENLLSVLSDVCNANFIRKVAGYDSVRYVHSNFEKYWYIDITSSCGDKIGKTLCLLHPWTRFDGTLNTDFFKMCEASIRGIIASRPGIEFSELIDAFPYLVPFQLEIILLRLQSSNYVTVTVKLEPEQMITPVFLPSNFYDQNSTSTIVSSSLKKRRYFPTFCCI